MSDQLSRYFLAAMAFAFVVTCAIAGVTIALLATAVCGAVAFGPTLRRAPARRTQTPRRRPTAHQLVPDDPSLVFTVSRSQG